MNAIQMAHAVQMVAQEVSRTGLELHGMHVDTPTGIENSRASLRVSIHAKSEQDARVLATLWGAQERPDEHLLYLHADWALMDTHIQIYSAFATVPALIPECV